VNFCQNHKMKKSDLSAFKVGIDRMVYQLYGLTDVEIAVVEGRV